MTTIHRPSSESKATIPLGFLDRRFVLQRSPTSLHAESLIAVDTAINNYKTFLEDSADPNDRRQWICSAKLLLENNGYSWGSASLTDVLTALTQNWTSIYRHAVSGPQLARLNHQQDSAAFRQILAASSEPILVRLSGSNSVGLHCSGPYPISAFEYGENDVAGGQLKSVIAASRLKPSTLLGHHHKCKPNSKIDHSSSVWFLMTDKENGFQIDKVLNHSTVHNNNSKEPWKLFFVMEVDWEEKADTMRTVPIPGCEGFRSNKKDLRIIRVWVVQCGPTGYFSEPEASIRLVRDNEDMKTPILNKKWTIKELS
jgi:hypothetical protein